jgi:hypothetical protein
VRSRQQHEDSTLTGPIRYHFFRMQFAGCALAGILLAKKTRLAATYLGTWIVLLVVFIYGPILIAAPPNPSTDVKIEGINYFFDTLLFAGVILALARATPPTD